MNYQPSFKPEITFWSRKEPNLKCLLLRFLTPIAGLLDALITICSFTLLVSNFEMEVVTLHSYEYFAQKIKNKEKQK
jgi:hypothetical protein